MNISPYNVKLITFEICMRKRVHITYTAISTDFIFALRYQHQVLEIMRLGKFRIIIPYWFNWVNEPRNIECNNPLPPQKCLWQGVNFVISACQYIIVLRETYKVKIQKYYHQYSVNEYMPSVWYLFLRKLAYKIQIHEYVCWNGDTIPKKSTMSPFCDHSTFDWLLELLHQKSPNGPCSSSRYSYK